MVNRLFLGLVLVFTAIQTQTYAQFNLGQSQEKIDYTKPKEYTVGGITVAGNNGLDENSILLLLGVEIGDKIKVPGDETRKIVKKFWEQDLFSDVQLYATKIEGELIFLELYLDELQIVY